MTTVAQVSALKSGECRWIARPDCHVYCHAPCGREPVYSLICPDAGHEQHNWTNARNVAAVIDKLVAGTTT